MPSKDSNSEPWVAFWEFDEGWTDRLYSQNDLDKIASALESATGRPIDEDGRESLFEHIKSDVEIFLIESQAAKGRPSVADAKKRLEKVKKSIEKLMDALRELDDYSFFLMLRELQGDKSPINVEHPMAIEINKVKSHGINEFAEKFNALPEVAQAALGAQNALPERGKSGNETHALHAFIRRLAAEYSSWTSIKRTEITTTHNPVEETYGGDFFHFVAACLVPIDPDQDRSDSAIAGHIRRVIKGLKSK